MGLLDSAAGTAIQYGLGAPPGAGFVIGKALGGLFGGEKFDPLQHMRDDTSSTWIKNPYGNKYRVANRGYVGFSRNPTIAPKQQAGVYPWQQMFNGVNAPLLFNDFYYNDNAGRGLYRGGQQISLEDALGGRTPLDMPGTFLKNSDATPEQWRAWQNLNNIYGGKGISLGGMSDHQNNGAINSHNRARSPEIGVWEDVYRYEQAGRGEKPSPELYHALLNYHQQLGATPPDWLVAGAQGYTPADTAAPKAYKNIKSYKQDYEQYEDDPKKVDQETANRLKYYYNDYMKGSGLFQPQSKEPEDNKYRKRDRYRDRAASLYQEAIANAQKKTQFDPAEWAQRIENWKQMSPRRKKRKKRRGVFN